MTKNIGNLKDKDGNFIFPEGIETIQNSDGIAYKFADGTLICTKIVSINVITNQPIGNLYRSISSPLGNYAIPFIEVPECYISAWGQEGDNYGIASYQSFASPTINSFGNIIAITGINNQNCSAKINCLAIGKWK